MNSYKKNAIGVGVLLICATILNVVGNNLYNHIIEAPDYLSRIPSSQGTIILGSLLVLLSAFACAGIAIGLYPVIRKHGEALALGSVGLRVIESVLYTVAVVGVLSLVPLSQEYGRVAGSDAVAAAGSALAAGAGASAAATAAGTILRAVDSWAGQVAVIAFVPGAIMYYWLLYRSRLVRRWLSGWGMVGAALSLVAVVLGMFGAVVPFSAVFVLMQLPLAVQELVLAVWLIAKGFDQSALTDRQAEAAGNTAANAASRADATVA